MSLYTVSNSGCTNLQSHQQCTKVHFSPYPHQHFLFDVIFKIIILTGVRCNLHVVLICIFLMISDFEYLFMWLLTICIPHLEKYIFRSTAHFLIGSFHGFDVDLYGFLYNLNINPFGDILFANIFPHSIGCFFILLIASFTVQMLFSMMYFHLFVFVLVSLAWEDIQKNIAKTDVKEHTVYVFF